MGWTWKQICADPTFTSLTNRVESDEWGNAVVLPISDADHSDRMSKVAHLLHHLLKKDGNALTIVPLQTGKGVKAVDAVWLSQTRRLAYPFVDDALVIAPEICVEVAARHNRPGEIEARLRLYFQRGAMECWICNVKGGMLFRDVTGPIPRSKICPQFPVSLKAAARNP